MKNLIFCVTLFFIAIAGCQQDHEMAVPTDPDPPVPPQEPPVSLIHTVTSGNESTVYEYDDSNRRIKAVNSDGSRTETEYPEGQAIVQSFKADGTLNYFATAQFNNDGLITKRTISNNAGYTEWYEYDDQQYPRKNTSVNGANTFESNFYYSNGNLDSTVYVRNNEFAYKYKYTYVTGKPNTINNRSYGTPYYGRDNKNLLKNWIGIGQNGQVFLQFTFAYTYDDKGRVLTQTQVSNDAVTTYSYTYY